MLSPARLYALVECWLQAMDVVAHRAARRSLAQLLTALLLAQSLSPAELARALPSPRAVPARQRFKRRARALDRPWLTSAHLTPALVRAALALVPTVGPAQPTTLVLDTVNCGGWDIVALGVLWRGRVLPVAWAVLPSPWPRGRFTPTVRGLVERVAACWPAERPVHLLADRGFASQALLRALRAAGWGFTLRLHARSALRVAGERRTAREVVLAAPVGAWVAHPAAAFGHGPTAPQATLVVGRPLRVTPAHQANPGGLRHRAIGAAKRAARVRHKNARPGDAGETDAWVILFTTHPTALGAQAAYRQRWAIEASFRDAQGGWDGRHGWNLEPSVAALTDAGQVDGLCGLWALGALVQTWLGAATVGPDVPAAVAAEAAGWTTSGRLSVWARGRFVLHDPSGRLTAWAAAVLTDGAARIAAARPAGSAPGRPAAPPARTAPAVTPFPTVTAGALAA
jgi:Transposase DDE domain